MSNLCFVPVIREAASAAVDLTSLPYLDPQQCIHQPRDLWLGEQGLIAIAAGAGTKPGEGTRLATVVVGEPSGRGRFAWWLIVRSPLLTINGLRPMPLAPLEQGDLLAYGAEHWFVASLWRPTPAIAHPSVADRQCPVCGGKLNLAPVVQCPCGRYYHLEQPEDPANPGKLNCYLASPCHLCNREPSLQPRLTPEPDATLVDRELAAQEQLS